MSMLFMRNFLMLIGFVFCFSNCKKESVINFSIEVFELQSKQNCQENLCSYVYLEIPKAIGNEEIASTINHRIFEYFKDKLLFSDYHQVSSYGSMADFFIQEYEKISATYPENYPLWQANYEVGH